MLSWILVWISWSLARSHYVCLGQPGLVARLLVLLRGLELGLDLLERLLDLSVRELEALLVRLSDDPADLERALHGLVLELLVLRVTRLRQLLQVVLLGGLEQEPVEVRLAHHAVVEEARHVDRVVVDHRDVVRAHARVADADRDGRDRHHEDERRPEEDRRIPLGEESPAHRGGSIAIDL